MTEVPVPGVPEILGIALDRLVLAPENVRKTPADASADNELRASIAAHGLLENLVVRSDTSDDDTERFAVVAGGRRLSALKALADDGTLPGDHQVPCKVVENENAGEFSLAENTARIAMHPADQVTAFSGLVQGGATVAAVAARFGISERTVEQRLRLGNAAPELLDAYRDGEIDLETLKAFAVTTDLVRQRAVWEQVSAQGHRPNPWQVRRLLTEERMPAHAAIASFVGIEAYEAAGGAVLRDLFADADENGVWLEDSGLVAELATTKLQAEADKLAARWKWAQAMIDVDWATTARYGRVHPTPDEPTAEETAEMERLQSRLEELSELDGDSWTADLEDEVDDTEQRLDEIETAIQDRAQFTPDQLAAAGCIVTVDDDGTLKVVAGLVRQEDMPKHSQASANDPDANGHDNVTVEIADGASPEISPPAASPPDPRATAREEAGIGIGLADDLRAIRTALVKAHLAGDFEASFDLAVFQLARATFAPGYTRTALDIDVRETMDRPATRRHDETFAAWSPGEAMLEDRATLPLEWLTEDDDAARFAALRTLPRADKEKLFAATVARSVTGQLAFEHDIRPELEATVARLDIDFAQLRPTADLLWSRIRKDRILAIARETLGNAWASSRAKYKKADLARAMEEAFAAGDRPAGVTKSGHAAALAWTMPGFAAFDAADADDGDTSDDRPDEASGADGEPDIGTQPCDASDVPEFLRVVS